MVFKTNRNMVGAKGAIGQILTAQRSLAVDPEFLPLGFPLWLDVAHPLQKGQRLQRLMFAQDTGSAIKGVIRGDFYWGSSPQGAKAAHQMKSRGHYYLFLPQSTPLPPNLLY